MLAPSLVSRFINRPVALAADRLCAPLAALAHHLGATQASWDTGEVILIGRATLEEREERYDGRPYSLLGGIAVIPVYGLLVQKLGTAWPAMGCTGYDGIRACLMEALDDAQVTAIVLDLDSPGGEVAALFDLADLITSARD